MANWVYLDPVTNQPLGSNNNISPIEQRVRAERAAKDAAFAQRRSVVAEQQAAGGFVSAGGAYIQPYTDSQTYAKDIILARKGSASTGTASGGGGVNTGNSVDDLFNWFNTPFFRDRQFSSATANADGTGTNYQNANFVQVMDANSGAYAGQGGRSGPSRQNYIQRVGNSLQDLTIGMFNDGTIDQQQANYILDTLSDGNNVERFINNWNGQPQLQQNSLLSGLDPYTRNQLLTLYSQELYGAIDTNQKAPSFPFDFNTVETGGASGRTYTGTAARNLREAESFRAVGDE